MPPIPSGSSRIYYCDCSKYCHGVLTKRSKRTFFAHKPHRAADTQAHCVLVNKDGTTEPYKIPERKRKNPPKKHTAQPHTDSRAEHENESSRAESSHQAQLPLPEDPPDNPYITDDLVNLDSIPLTPPPVPVPDPQHTGDDAYASSSGGGNGHGAPTGGNCRATVEECSDDEDPVEDSLEDPQPEPTIEDLRNAKTFIDEIKKATLDTDKLPPEVLKRLRNPPTEVPDLKSPAIRVSLDIYLSLDNCSIQQYNNIRESLARNIGTQMLSYADVKKLARDLSGVYPVYDDMCINSCLAFTGPFSKDDRCAICGEPRTEMRFTSSKSRTRKEVPRLRSLTIPMGPQLQAMYATPEGAEAMRYRRRCTARVLEEIKSNGGVQELADYIYGTQYINAVITGDIKDGHIVLLFSLDGAQLYIHKGSDCWIYIWVVLERAPENRYKKKHVLIGGIIPGPKKPKNIDSFLFRGLFHLSALMSEGLHVWDAFDNTLYIKNPYVAFVTADGPGMAYLNGGVGHTGAQGCRLFCGQKGRLKPNANHYYPALLKPDDYDIDGSCHDDIDLRDESSSITTSPERYLANLNRLMAASRLTDHRRLRLETGLSKPSIFSGLANIFPLPGCFPADIMHLVALNLLDLFFKLWRGQLDCDKNDDKTSWDWVCLKGTVWKTHGQAVADTRPYLPGSFDRPPRNPAEKINSRYKAVEFLNYMYGLGPAMFQSILPERYWSHFCMLVQGIRLLHQRVIHVDEVREAHRLLVDFCEEYEELYYQCNSARLHFVCQSIHALVHMSPETSRIGPYVDVSQWTMERQIGELVAELRQPSNSYRNLAERAIRKAQVNAMKAMYPEFCRDKPMPAGAVELGDGYLLLRATDARIFYVSDAQTIALQDLSLRAVDIPMAADWLVSPGVVRWARLRLPNRQIARSLWAEERRANLRISRNIKYRTSPTTSAYGEVHFYFKIDVSDTTHAFAMVQKYSNPDEDLLRRSYHTVWSCSREHAFVVINVKDINSVVAMIPHPRVDGQLGPYSGWLFVMEKMGLDIMPLTGEAEVDEEVPVPEAEEDEDEDEEQY